MSRLCIETRGIGNWRERLADPGTQWKRSYSAFETAVAWELACERPTGLPEPFVQLFRNTVFGEPTLVLAIAEHKVALPGGRAESQCDVWALLDTKSGGLSLSVEAKAKESFGQNNEPLATWLIAGETEQSQQNRKVRWEHIEKYLPASTSNGYSQVAYQLLHRCASAVIEAERLHLPNAAFVVQAFNSPPESFEAYSQFCQSAGVKAEKTMMHITNVGNVRLGIGWADCPFATDAEIASVA